MKYLSLFLLILVGCESKKGIDVQLKSIPFAETDDRISVTRIGIFNDELAYGDKRGIYLIQDRNTHKEFIGISGIGISELGKHTDSDDDVIRDER